MIKNGKDKANRIAFVHLCIDNPEEGERYLKKMAKKIGKTKKTTETVKCLRDILFVSEWTIYRDFSK